MALPDQQHYMPLNVGDRLGPYKVTAKIGEGGMGEVYQARDTKLDRDVALKVLPEAFTADTDRLARFEREAKVLASLNHPNIGSIYGLEEQDGVRALVLELVEGPTLADLIARPSPQPSPGGRGGDRGQRAANAGAAASSSRAAGSLSPGGGEGRGEGGIPLDEALPIAKQIAEALEAAHEAGVIHRDLKPANIKVREDGTVKVLDFGLAKALDPNPDADPSQSPTLTAAATQMGMIMGTAAYMSPEQARGKTVDKRADIWAFGAVLFEMVTGQKVFGGDDVSLTLSAVLQRDPDWDAVPKTLPAVVGTYLRRCLEKDPRERVRDIGDVRLALQGAFETTAEGVDASPEVGLFPQVTGKRLVLPVLAALLVGALAGLALRNDSSTAPGVPVRSTIAVPPEVQLLVARNNPLALSPDGNRLVYAAQRGATSQLYLRDLGRFQAAPIPGTEGGTTPFFSPDGRWVGFVADGTELRKVLVDEGGGTSLTIARLPDPGTVAHLNFVWGSDAIIGGWAGGPLLTVPATGGELEPLPGFGFEPDDFLHGFPQFLPGEQGLLFNTVDSLELLDLATGVRTELMGVEGSLTVVNPRYVASGHLVYGQGGNLMAVPFDLEQRMVTGTPTPVLSGVYASGRINSHYYALSSGGTLVYVAGQSGNRLAWVGRDGSTEPIAVSEGTYRWPRLSPDGRQVAVTVASPAMGTTNIWIGSSELDRLRPLTTGLGFSGVWVPDEPSIVFAARDGIRRQDIGSPSIVLLERQQLTMPRAWTPDGALLFEADGDIRTLTEDGVTSPLLSTAAEDVAPTMSPDGTWLAYVSNESGRPEIWARSWPGMGTVTRISADGGTEPAWARDGRELFYRNGDQMLSVAVADDGTFGHTEILFERRFATDLGDVANYDVAPDGRFLMILTDEDSTTTQVNLIQNWLEELERLVPTGNNED